MKILCLLLSLFLVEVTHAECPLTDLKQLRNSFESHLSNPGESSGYSALMVVPNLISPKARKEYIADWTYYLKEPVLEMVDQYSKTCQYGKTDNYFKFALKRKNLCKKKCLKIASEPRQKRKSSKEDPRVIVNRITLSPSISQKICNKCENYGDLLTGIYSGALLRASMEKKQTIDSLKSSITYTSPDKKKGSR